jgi:hypothetical protein
MAGRIPVYRQVGDVSQMRPGKADRGICTSCHRTPSRALPPATAQLSERRKGAALDLASLRTSQLQLAFKGRIGEARDQIAIAHDALSDMDIAVFAERARRELSATSGRRGRRNAAAPSAQLTSQELQIAQLVQQGLSNREIGCLTDQMIRRGVHKSVQALETGIRALIENWNQNPRPFTWTKTAEEILDSLAKISRISGAGH